ncbi:MAG: YggS family pyridoxal phosphate-dependent enzyme [Rickettsiales bacterium]|nr:YggS family pyridoxal phosphate-dependent enzyme [Rickettsiales bacterium]RPG13643.1 MAG: YggS family pyridoxal phosphate-dependent enzyme [Pelagibacteraceae bacterium TMED195]|tara:strand:+ start:1966 stop:2625 length:660 start_codon:yes stop_codon:yes gene_type:complete
MNKIIENYKRILIQIERYNKEFSATTRNPKLIAVSKTFSEEKIQLVIDQGHHIFGENKVQEATEKWINLKKRNKKIELHLIGPLQSNKVKQALEVFDVIQTIDREKIVKKIKDNLNKKEIKCFVQVNIGNEPQKNGLKISELDSFVEWCINDVKLGIDGLMCIPPIEGEPSYYFNLLSNLKEKLKIEHASMGMSNDFAKAIQFGATYLRVGSAIFGNRS